MLLWLTLLIIAVPVVYLASYIDNWERDLSTNHAATADQSADQRLRPLLLTLPVEKAKALISQTIESLPNWTIEETWHPDQLHATRRTSLWGFVDDIHITVSTVENKTRVDAESQSRVGKGDLGQNPRNIDQLFQAIRKNQSRFVADKS